MVSPIVCLYEFTQTWFLRKSKSANFTRKQFLSTIYPHVAFQIVTLKKSRYTRFKKCTFPVCVCMSFFKKDLSENTEPQTWNEKCFSLAYVPMLLFYWDLWEHADLKISKEMVSLQCVFAWVNKSMIFQKMRIYRLHKKMFSLRSVAFQMGTLRKCRFTDFQKMAFLPFVWVYSDLIFQKLQIRSLHKKMFSPRCMFVLVY